MPADAFDERRRASRAVRSQGSAGPPAYWLVDDKARDVVAGPQWTREALGPAPDDARVVEAPGRVRVVRATGGAPGSWFALDDSAAVTDADVAAARPARAPGTNESLVAVDLTARGETMFGALTREVAHRGKAAQRPGTGAMPATLVPGGGGSP